MKVDLEMIKQRKALYGNSFKDIALRWENLLGIIISPKAIADLMAELKQSRIDFIKEQMQRNDLTINEYNKLKEALEDSILDKNNYLWIAKNYEEYLKL